MSAKQTFMGQGRNTLRVRIFVSMFFVVLLLGSNFIYGAIPARERAALIALYNATNGDQWTQNSGWKTPPLHTDGFAMPGTEGSWYGVNSNSINVTSLHLSRNYLVGNIPPELGNLSYLQRIDLQENQLSGSIPPELGNLSNLTYLFLFDNQLSGAIPPEIGNLNKMKACSIYNNQLSGSIPPELGNLSSLNQLQLNMNQLSGSIPPELGNLGSLQLLDFRQNQLSGSIPSELRNLSYLTVLYLNNNQLSGPIPTDLGNLFRLEGLFLHYNQLSGEIPSSLATLDRITSEGLDIGYNCLFATDPTLRTYLNTKDPDWEAHQDQCGGLTVTSPNGGETFPVGSSQPITWTTTGTVGNVKIEYTTNNGTTWTTIIASTANDGSYTWTLPVTVSTLYKVKVSEAADGNPTDMSNSTFSVVADPTATLTVTSPNGGESWAVGSSQNITWTTTGTVGNVFIEYTANNGSTWSTIISSTANDGSYTWTVPDPPSSLCKIRISEAVDNIPIDTSDSTFTVAASPTSSITVTSPNGGESWTVGSSQTITWSTTGTVGNVQIDYTINNGSSWDSVVDSTANDGSYIWTVPDTPSIQCKIRISEASDGSPTDSSDSTFTIAVVSTASITVVTPNGGESWNAGSSQSITWTTSGTVGNVLIEYTTNNGSSWTTIVASTVNDGAYTWTVPDIPSTLCKIRISEAVDENPTDTSDSTFTIASVAPATITLTSPNGGESVTVDSTQPITWTTSGTVGNVQIEYSTDNGSSWDTITASTANDGSFIWTVPDIPSTLCLIKISEASDGSPTDTSNSTFTIVSASTSSITVLSPNGGESWPASSSQTITWSTTGTVGNVHIQYSTTSGSSWSTVTSSTTNDGAYTWTVPTTASSQCLVKISEAADGSPSDTSDSTFTIDGTISAQERAALIALYNSTNGDTWTNKTGWKTAPLDADGFAMPGTEGNWYGVMVQGYHVTRINLYWNNLIGTIPAALGNLPQLQVLWLTANQLTGSIPTQLGNLSNLQSLWLGENQLDGALPDSLANLSNLEMLYIRNNRLSGEIPTGFIHLVHISLLDIGYNCLTATSSVLRTWLNALDPDWETTQNQCGGISPTILVTSPNGGEIFTVDSSQSITWTTTGIVGDVKIECSINNGTTWSTIITATANDGFYTWTVPNTISSQCKIKISEASDGTPTDTSNSNFSIVSAQSASITVVSPNGGESWAVGSTQTITWTTTGTVGNVKIQYSFDNSGTWTTIAANISNTGSYTWTVPNTPSPQCLVKISEAADGSPSDTSDATFTIVPQSSESITITSPNGGENWNAGSLYPVTWTTTGTVGDVKIQYSPDNGSTWLDVISATGNDGLYNWTVPTTLSSLYKVKISEAADGSPTDTSDATFSIVPGLPPVIHVNWQQLNFTALSSGSVTGPQRISIRNSGGGTLNWTTGVDASWLNCTPTTGTGNGTIVVSVAPTGLKNGSNSGRITITDPNATNSPLTVLVTLIVKPANQKNNLIGEFSTPVNEATVGGSIAVTGWALDDIGVKSVEIYREADKKKDLVFIGEAIFVAGARPDIEAAYPDYPFNYQAGWGYLLLTNSLPNGGNGVFTLYAVATDMDGNSITLGEKTITVDNANSVKPFGAIDTPKYGGIISGSDYVNWGWALTPQPSVIPTDGSTIQVWVDGMMLGNPNYNVTRTDIAALFPGYANSNGAGGYFHFDTTDFAEGMHTIQWSVTDDAGHTDGIGSRYFYIERATTDTHSSTSTGLQSDGIAVNDLSTLDTLLLNNRPILVKDGYNDMPPQVVQADEMGFHQIKVHELALIHIQLFEEFGNQEPHRLKGYLLTNDRLQVLPVGSTLDSQKGVFHWQLAAGFSGEYHLVFIEQSETEQMTRKDIIVTIKPQYPVTQ